MAAGLSLPEENLEIFRRKINETSGITEEDLQEKIRIDMQLPFSGVTEKFVQDLSILEPFGKANSKPVFAQNQVKVYSARILGANQNVLKMRVGDRSGIRLDAMYFGDAWELLDTIEMKYGEKAKKDIFII